MATADACPTCGGGLRPLGEDVAEQLEFLPAIFRSDPPCAPENSVLLLRRRRPGAGAKPAD